jgi:hypothetical protein
MKRVFLHIGMPRTATTSLQALLTRAGRAGGILYPDIYKDAEGFGHHNLVHAISEDPNVVATELARFDSDVLISAEFLFNTLVRSRRPIFTAFLDALKNAGFEVTIVCGVRPISELAWSLYLQSIRSGEYHQDYRKYFESAAAGVMESLASLDELAPRVRVEILKYSKTIIEDFTHLVFGDAAPQVLAHERGDRLSLSPSLLLHAYFLWRVRSGPGELPRHVHWWLIGRDMEGGLFDGKDANFERISSDELNGELSRRAAAIAQFSDPRIHQFAEYVIRPSEHIAYDLRVRTAPINLETALKTLASPQRFDREVLDGLAESIRNFASL